MQKIERKKLILIIGVAVALVIAATLIIINLLVGNSEEESTTPTPTPTPQLTEVEDGLTSDIGDMEEVPDNVSETQFDNDYSEDEGYIPLPEDFDENTFPTEGTVFEDSWSYTTINRVVCEFGHKNTVTERSIKDLKALANDLRYVPSGTATDYRNHVQSYVDWAEENMGNRITEDIKNEIEIIYCNRLVDSHSH